MSVSLLLRVGQYVASAGQAAASTRQIVSEVENLGKTSPSKFNAVTAGAAVAGGALLGMAGYAVHAAMAFDKQMSEVGAVSNATGKQMEGLRAIAIQAGKDTQYSATEAAAAEAELAKAGITTADIMGGALKGSLSLAAAGQMGLADAATIAAQTMNIFELKGKDVAHIADVLASAANVSAADMHGLGLGLQQVGLVAHQAGFSLEETTGLLAAFADRGLQGSDGATSLKTAIQHLIAPVPQAADLMGRLGLSVYDTNGHVRSAAELAGQLQSSLGKLSVEERNTAMNTIFGSDAIRAANVLYTLGADGVTKYTGAVDKNGAAADVAAKKTDNLAGDLERLKGSVETLAIQAGSGANGGIRILVQSIDGLVGSFSSLPGPVQTSLTVLAGVGGSGLVATAGLLKARQAGHDAMEALSAMGPMGDKASTALGKIGSAAGKLTVIGAVGFGLYEGLMALMDATSHGAGVISHDLDQVTEGLVRFANSGRSSGEAARVIGHDLNEFAAHFTQAITAVGTADTSGSRQAIKNIEELDQGFAKMVQGGYTVQAKTLVDRFTAAMLEQGYTLDQINNIYLPKYNAAAADAAAGNTGLAKGFGDAAGNARTLAGGIQAAIDAGKTMKQTFDELNGANINLTQAQINAEAAVDKLTEALTKSNGELDLNTEKGRAAAQASVDLAQKGRDVAQSTFEQTQNAEQARGVFEAYRQQLINNIATAGGTKQATDQSRRAAELLASQIMQMPAFKKIDISLPGIDSAIEKVISIQTHLNGLQNRTITVTTIQNTQTGETYTRQRASAPFNRWGGLYEHAAEGALRDANIYQAVSSGARYAFAEPETQGEFFGPKSGNLARTRSMATYAVENWWGGHVTWGRNSAPVMRASGGSAGGVGPSAEAIADALATRLVPALSTLAAIADRPIDVNVDSQRIAQAVRQGNRGLGRRG